MTAAGTPAFPDPPTEVRFALAMNGGVSLAVWIGGVCNELLAFVRAGERLDDPSRTLAEEQLDPYELVLYRSNTRVRVDVMTGASAGGMNAVFLALGLLYGHRNLSALRDLWLAAGSFESLLRDPQDKAAPSLMKGDDYFLVELRRAIKQLMTVEHGQAKREIAVDVQLTITALDGDETRMVVANGEPIVERKHDFLLRFRNGGAKRLAPTPSSPPDEPKPRPITFDGEPYSDFDPTHVDRLARACRSTASFPGAFEPSLVKLASDAGTSDPNHFLPHQTTLRRRNKDQPGRFVIDGGTLVNLPVKEAIDAIFEQRPSGAAKMHRVFAIVVPDPSTSGTPSAEDDSKPAEPELTAVIGGALSTIPRNQVVTNFLRELSAQNLDLMRLHVARRRLLDQDRTIVSTLAGQLFAAYQDGRRDTTAHRVMEALESHPTLLEAPAGSSWPRDEWRAALVRVAEHFPWVPERRTANGDHWGWSTIKRSAQRAVFIIREDGGQPADAANERITNVLRAVERLDESTVVAAMIGDIRQPDDAELERLLAEGWRQTGGDAVMTTIAEQLVGLNGPAAVAGLPDIAAAKQLLLDLEIIEQSFGSYEARTDQSVEVIRIDSLGPCALDPLGRDAAATKVAGVQLAHFASFLKATWRANDWAWGRLDGSGDVVKVLCRAGAADRMAIPRDDVVEMSRAIQASIMDEELNTMLEAIQADRAAGAAESSSAMRVERFARDRSIVANSPQAAAGTMRPPLTMQEARTLLGMARFGEESIADETGSDLLTKVASNALATGATVLKSGGPKLLSQPLTAVRYVSLIAYGLVRGALGGTASRAIATAVFGFGVAVTAIGIYGTDLGVLRPIGVSLAIAGTLIGFHRSPSIAGPLIAVGLTPALLTDLPKTRPRWYPINWWWPSTWFATHAWVPAVSFAAAAVIVGTLRRPRWAQVRRRVNAAATKNFEIVARGNLADARARQIGASVAFGLVCGIALVAFLVSRGAAASIVAASTLVVGATGVAAWQAKEEFGGPEANVGRRVRNVLWAWYQPSDGSVLVGVLVPLYGVAAAVRHPDETNLLYCALILCGVAAALACTSKVLQWRGWSGDSSRPAPDAALVWTMVPACVVVIAALIVQLADDGSPPPPPRLRTIVAVILLVTALAGPAFMVLVAVTGWRRGYLIVGSGAGLIAFAWAWVQTRAPAPLTTAQRWSFGVFVMAAAGLFAWLLAAMRVRSRTILGALTFAIAVWALLLVAQALPRWMPATTP